MANGYIALRRVKPGDTGVGDIHAIIMRQVQNIYGATNLICDVYSGYSVKFTGIRVLQGWLKGLRLEMGLLAVEVEGHPGGLQDYDWGC